MHLHKNGYEEGVRNGEIMAWRGGPGLTSNRRRCVVREWQLNTVGGGHTDKFWEMLNAAIIWVDGLTGVNFEAV